MKEQNQQFTVSDTSKPRLDVFLAESCSVTRSQVQKWMKFDVVRVNNESPKKHGVRLAEGDVVSLVFDEYDIEVKPELEDEDIALLDSVDIISETDEYIVINKPCGLISHPADRLDKKDDIMHTVSVSSWVLRHDETIWGVGEYADRPGVVHRLDKDTSGIMVVAKTQKMFDHLKSQFKNRLVQKSYIALVHGVFEKNNVVLDFDIAMGTDGKMAARPKVDEVNLKNVTSLQSGKKAHTDVHVLERFVRHTLVEAKPKTGRTHQIRVHLYAFNHPIVGDPVYLNKKVQHKKDKELQRLFLHSRTLAFTDVAGEVVSFEADIPQELTDFLESLT